MSDHVLYHICYLAYISDMYHRFGVVVMIHI